MCLYPNFILGEIISEINESFLKCKLFAKKGTIQSFTNEGLEQGPLAHCAIYLFDLTEPVEIELHTDKSDQYAPAGVRIFVNESFSFFSSGQIPDNFPDVTNSWFSKANNNKPLKMQHFLGHLFAYLPKVAQSLEAELEGFHGIQNVTTKKRWHKIFDVSNFVTL